MRIPNGDEIKNLNMLGGISKMPVTDKFILALVSHHLFKSEKLNHVASIQW